MYKYHLFPKNVINKITNNNIPFCNMEQYADFQLFANT